MDLQECIWESTLKLFRDGKPFLLLFDGTNWWWFARKPDEDLYDEEGNLVMKAFRTLGFSKENRSTFPLVNLGLFVRVGGMPVKWVAFPGKEKEVSHVPEELEKIKEMFHPGQFILVCDRGNWSKQIISTVINLDKSADCSSYYIIGKGIRNASVSLQEFARSKEGWKDLEYTGNDGRKRVLRIKARIMRMPVTYTQKNGSKVHLETEQMEIIHYSPSYARKEQARRKKDEKTAEKMAVSRGMVTSALNSGKLKYLDVEVSDKTVRNPDNRKVRVDRKKLAEEQLLDGFYVITSNLLEESPVMIYRQYRDLHFAENDFKIMKSFLDLRPMYVRLRSHIVALTDVCVIALAVLRLLEKLLDGEFGAVHILESLRNFQAIRDNGRYRILGEDPVIRKLKEVTGCGFDHELIDKRDINRVYTIGIAVVQGPLFE